jgi:hypothetical protein
MTEKIYLCPNCEGVYTEFQFSGFHCKYCFRWYRDMGLWDYRDLKDARETYKRETGDSLFLPI